MADGDLLEVLDAPEIAVLADGPEIEARDAERLGADLGVPAIEAAEVEVGRAVRQPPRLDRIEVVDQEQEDVAVRGIERGRVLGDVDPRDCRCRSTSRARPGTFQRVSPVPLPAIRCTAATSSWS